MDGINYNSAFIRSNVERVFATVCNSELNQFQGILDSMNKINKFLRSKSTNNLSLETYAEVINKRICEHMISATLLIGKGLAIDGINIVRSSYEDLWLLQNMFFREGYFEEWLNGQEVRPWRLRQLKEIEEIKEENEIIYKALCNISHCSKASIEHMVSVSTSMEPVINDYRLVLISFYSFSIQLLEALENYYGEDEELENINNGLLSLNLELFKEEGM